MGTTKKQLQAKLAATEAEIARLRARDTAPIQYPTDAARAVAVACIGAYKEQETFVAVYLDARQRVLHTTIVAVGSLSAVDVHPREVFRDAVRLAAHAIVIGHNHPSGVTTPSAADRTLTRRLRDAGEVMGIPVIDHVIVADGQPPYSFVAQGEV